MALFAWAAWFLFGSVTIYEVSRHARLESGIAARDVSALQSGRLAVSNLQIGRTVHQGDVLVELDAGDAASRAREEQDRLGAYPEKLLTLRREIDARQAAMADEQRAAQASVQSATARQSEAAAAAVFARENERRIKAESASGGVSEVDALRAASEASRAVAAADALSADVRKLELDAQTHGHQAQAQIEDLRRTLQVLQSDSATSGETVTRLKLDLESRRVRAPVSGTIGEVLAVRPGAYVAEGQKLATIVPAGSLVVVAEFDPASALGRVNPGQPARVSLDGFPWIQYGAVEARVQRVATELRDNALRVELTPEPSNPRLAPILRHGLSGRVEIQVEKISPATLLLRSIGRSAESSASGDKPVQGQRAAG